MLTYQTKSKLKQRGAESPGLMKMVAILAFVLIFSPT